MLGCSGLFYHLPFGPNPVELKDYLQGWGKRPPCPIKDTADRPLVTGRKKEPRVLRRLLAWFGLVKGETNEKQG